VTEVRPHPQDHLDSVEVLNYRPSDFLDIEFWGRALPPEFRSPDNVGFLKLRVMTSQRFV